MQLCLFVLYLLKNSVNEESSEALDKETSDMCDGMQGGLRLAFKNCWTDFVFIPSDSCLWKVSTGKFELFMLLCHFYCCVSAPSHKLLQKLLMCHDYMFKLLWIVVTDLESRHCGLTKCVIWNVIINESFRSWLSSTDISIFLVTYALDLGSSSFFRFNIAQWKSVTWS